MQNKQLYQFLPHTVISDICLLIVCLQANGDDYLYKMASDLRA